MKNNNSIHQKKWKFVGNIKKILIEKETAIKYSENENWVLYDTRTKGEYNDGHFHNSVHVSFFRIKHYILNNDKKTHILLIGRFERTHINIVSWSRFHGYKHIYLLKDGIDLIKDRKYLVSN